jgi:hypothetical protein
MSLSTAEVVILIVTVVIGFVAKGVTGIGAPLIIVPVMAGFTGLEFAVAVVVIPTVIANTWLLWRTREAVPEVAWFLWPLLVAGAVGTVVGSWILVTLDDRIMTITLAVIVLAYIGWSLLNRDFKLSDRWARRLSAPAGLLGGVLQGGTGASGPVVATYVHALSLERAAFVLAVTLPFQVLGAVQLVSLTVLGGYDRERLIFGAIATIPALLAMGPAMNLGSRLSKSTFRMVVLIMLALASIRLIWSVL